MPTEEQVWQLFYKLEPSTKNKFRVYQANNRDQVQTAFNNLAQDPNTTAEDVKQVVEGLLRGPSSPATPDSSHFQIDTSVLATKSDIGALRSWMSKKGAHKDDLTGVATKDDINQLRLEFGLGMPGWKLCLGRLVAGTVVAVVTAAIDWGTSAPEQQNRKIPWASSVANLIRLIPSALALLCAGLIYFSWMGEERARAWYDNAKTWLSG